MMPSTGEFGEEWIGWPPCPYGLLRAAGSSGNFDHLAATDCSNSCRAANRSMSP
jgi:hypothetical protein